MRYVEEGLRARFTGNGGYDHEREYAAARLTPGKEYVVYSSCAGGCHSTISVRDNNGELTQHNTVMFEFTYEPLFERVQRGAQLLDSLHPYWFAVVDPAQLSFMSGYKCILGQLAGGLRHLEGDADMTNDWTFILHQILPGASTTSDETINHGFNTVHAPSDKLSYEVRRDQKAITDDLAAYWRREIADRLQHPRSVTDAYAAAGAAHLDKVLPGWHEKIDLDRLNIRFFNDCILGQLNSIPGFGQHPWSTQHGFLGMYTNGPLETPEPIYAKLNEALTLSWTDEINYRRAQQRVRNGVQRFFDVRDDDWWVRLDFKSLDILSADKCVMAQVFDTGFRQAADKLGAPESFNNDGAFMDWMFENGFSARQRAAGFTPFTDAERNYERVLRKAWQDIIEREVIPEQRAKRGAIVLDEKVPGWFGKIDLKDFDVGSASRCVLTHVYGSYVIGCEEIAKDVACGFTHFYFRQSYIDLCNTAWREEILQRLETTGFGDYEARVDRGESLLEKADSEWFLKINSGDLDINSSCKCIAGQWSGRDHFQGFRRLGVECGTGEAYYYGLATAPDDKAGLEAAWLRRIHLRKNERTVKLEAERLDRLKPGWHKLVDIKALRMNSPCRCILGQVYADESKGTTYSSYRIGTEIVTLDGADKYSAAYAGCLGVHDAWVKEIKQRCQS